jgi:glucose-6-phosphate 1-dehydrogenase
VIETLVLFGATGDLAGRYLLPALAALYESRRLPDNFGVVGAARDDWDDRAFRRHAEERLEEHAAGLPFAARERVVGGLRYRQVDLEDAGSITRVIDTAGPEPLAAYLALPPALFPVVVTALTRVGLPRGSRVAVEKPFGEDLEGAIALNALLAELSGAAGEQVLFRVDHVLGMATVHNLLGLRLANRLLEPVWNGLHIEQIDVLWEETLALEGRAGYYDQTGALKDVMQNHMLQVLSLLAMEPPPSLHERHLRDAKVAVLRSIRPPARGDMGSLTRRARYAAGRIGDRAVPSYADEQGVDPERGTETFAEVVLALESPRWAGTRFVLRAGKALGRRRKEAVVRFRPVTSPPFGGEHVAGQLRIGVDGPEDVALQLAGRQAGAAAHLTPVMLTGKPPSSGLPPYGHVLLDLLGGDSALSVRGDEAEAAWRVVTPVLEAWADGGIPLDEYPAGSAGPAPLTAWPTPSSARSPS